DAPFEPDELDELLSADLDGELEAAARDFGLSIEEVTARLRATSGGAERRAALAAARDRLARAPELDELLDARLRAKAVRAAEDEIAARASQRRERRRHALQAVSGFAAAAVVVIGVSAALRHDSASSKATSAPARSVESGGSARGAPTQATTNQRSLGSFSDVHSLGTAAVHKARADQATKGFAARSSAQSSTRSSTAPNAATGTTAQDSSGGGTIHPSSGTATAPVAPLGSSFSAAQHDAVAKCGVPRNVPVRGALVLRAAAVLSGRPVVVLVFADDGYHTVLIESPDCTLRNLQQFR
ncbi:MAG: hypothetical protein QOJ71_861, partial [Actinomycetota bacterium]|nr:hypothetical protein [Actinomycetota bacterium]